MHRNSANVYTKQQRIAELAKQSPQMGFTSMAYLMDIDWLREAYRRTHKDGAVGVDGQTAAEYEQMREFLRRRVRDGVLLRLIGKWLNAGVLEEGSLSYPESGSPQGGVITPPTILQKVA